MKKTWNDLKKEIIDDLKAAAITVGTMSIMVIFWRLIMPTYPPDRAAIPYKSETLHLWPDRPTRIQVYDWAEEDGDAVEINGTRIELKHQPTFISVQWPDEIRVTGVSAGRDGKVITVAFKDEKGHESQWSVDPHQTVVVETKAAK